jgi:hypothetical protein
MLQQSRWLLEGSQAPADETENGTTTGGLREFRRVARPGIKDWTPVLGVGREDTA